MNKDELKPPYVAFETFKTFLRALKESAVPNRIDSSMMPTSMSGFNKTGVTTALKFFDLIDSDGHTTSNLRKLVESLDSDEWPVAVKEILLPSYDDIVGDLKLETATRRQLDEKFVDASVSMKDRFIRFYIPLMEDAGIKVSPYLKQRQTRPKRSVSKKNTSTRKQKNQKENPASDPATPPGDTPSSMFDQLIPMQGINEKSFIRIPKSINMAQFEMVKAAVAFIEVMAKQNDSSE